MTLEQFTAEIAAALDGLSPLEKALVLAEALREAGGDYVLKMERGKFIVEQRKPGGAACG